MSKTLLSLLKERNNSSSDELLERWNKTAPYSPLVQLLAQYHQLKPSIPVDLLIDDKTKVYQFLNHLDVPAQQSKLESEKIPPSLEQLTESIELIEDVTPEEPKIIKRIEPITELSEGHPLDEIEEPIIESVTPVEEVVTLPIVEIEVKPVLNPNSKASLLDWLKQTH